MSKKPTMQDVATHANVSIATVSYVLNGVKKVSDKTKEKVFESIRELNYYPDSSAVSLSRRKSNLIGILIPMLGDSPAAMFKKNIYYNEFVSGIEVISRKNNYDTMISGVAEPEDVKGWVKKRNLDGLIYIGELPENLYEELIQLDVPLVLIDTYAKEAANYNNVRIQDERGGYLATKHLIELGHTKVAFVPTNLQTSPVDLHRMNGYRRALSESGIAFDEDLVFESYDVKFEQPALVNRIVTADPAPTGIVTVSDVLAIGVINELKKLGKSVPDDYSVIGFDDLIISEYITPPLTTVRQDIFTKGRTAAELVIASIEEESHGHNTVVLPVELVERESTRKL
ncbi:LacI family DNA-binding transcriptional regulator [Paenalkalicoccus suaedae]|uniref:LacI family DNA-binding transcriptional regulator n=1 Tax=Paenalkalicoccus suaedae TaxID=2592382 RepID=A0A859FGQ3_9BACI|nr:LacI family DNA-binding transcriptional regulator [Paenalkalicoccus suaedae]QKS72543.1 LacI family DNA-binding transcriptional regulator [Paenalkalicoccus suaedae]